MNRPSSPKLAVQVGLAFTALVLASAGWLLEPLTETPARAEPVAQAKPSPPARPTRTPVPTLTVEQKAVVEQEVRALEKDKLEREINLLERQEERLEQQRDTERQAWRAPGEAVASFGPTLVGLGLLYLLARALNHWIPPEPAREAAPEGEEEDEL